MCGTLRDRHIGGGLGTVPESIEIKRETDDAIIASITNENYGPYLFFTPNVEP